MLKVGDIVTLRRASYSVTSDTITFVDTLLGQFEVKKKTAVPIGTNKVAKPIPLTAIDKAVCVDTHGKIVYGDSLDPQTAKHRMFYQLRDYLETQRARHNRVINTINSLLDKVSDELPF